MVSQHSNDKDSGFNTSAVVWCGAAFVIFMFAVSLFLQGGFRAVLAREYAAKFLAPENRAVRETLAGQQAVLEAQPRWLDKETGRVGIPIDLAKQIVIDRAERKDP